MNDGSQRVKIIMVNPQGCKRKSSHLAVEMLMIVIPSIQDTYASTEVVDKKHILHGMVLVTDESDHGTNGTLGGTLSSLVYLLSLLPLTFEVNFRCQQLAYQPFIND